MASQMMTKIKFAGVDITLGGQIIGAFTENVKTLSPVFSQAGSI
jgi:hypothetical protein